MSSKKSQTLNVSDFIDGVVFYHTNAPTIKYFLLSDKRTLVSDHDKMMAGVVSNFDESGFKLSRWYIRAFVHAEFKFNEFVIAD